jgi:HPt (histidine-containing phosphotransfer) domain-containing protein
MDATRETEKDLAAVPVRPPKGIPVQVMDAFLARCRANAGGLTAVLDRGEFEPIRIFGHRLKGSGGAYGIAELTAMGAMIEGAAINGDSRRLEELIDSLQKFVSRLEVQPE